MAATTSGVPTTRGYTPGVFADDAVGSRVMRIESLTLARPSLLLGDRPKQRLGESLASHFGWLMPARAKPVHAAQVAAGLLAAAHEAQPGVRILDNQPLRRMPLAPSLDSTTTTA